MIPVCLASLLSIAIATASTTNDAISISAPNSVEQNGSVVLQCNYVYENVKDENILFKWFFTPEEEGKDNKQMLLYQRFGKNKYYNAKKLVVKDDDAIEISNAQTTDTGNYTCTVDEEGGNYKQQLATSHHLTVYSPGSGPQLSITKAENGTGIVVTCTADDVSPYPDLILRIDGKDKSLDPVVEYDDATRYFSISYNYTTADESGNFEASCELTFDASVTHPPYVATVTYNAGGESTTEGANGTTTEEVAEVSSVPTDGSSLLRLSWLSLLAAPLLLALVLH
ncbi:hypothetical protein O0L34_g2164 [Tuta absoluta]|nr:hypothetical protein O0L34_g2164 [Tuta absoluta]